MGYFLIITSIVGSFETSKLELMREKLFVVIQEYKQGLTKKFILEKVIREFNMVKPRKQSMLITVFFNYFVIFLRSQKKR
jgi:hypothetical protein